MQIIVVGCGNVGYTLAEQLSKESHNVVVIDRKSDRLKQVSEAFDVMCVQGDGASHSIQLEAGVEDADLLIAVTNSDEVNLLCCLIARKAGGCHTIARVRNPIYNREISFIKEELGLSLVINPELAAATEIASLLKYPSAMEMDGFSRGRVELFKLRLDEGNLLVGCTLKRAASKLNCDVLVCAVERGEDVVIPDGSFELHAGDKISVIASSRNLVQFFRKMNLLTARVRDAMIVGGGSTAYYLTRKLQAMNVRVKIIEKNSERCDELCELLPQAEIVCGDGTDRDLLIHEGLAKAEAFITMTELDEENIMLSLFAKMVSKAKLVTRIHRSAYEELINSLDLGSVIYPQYITAENIVSYVRGMSNSLGSNVETLHRIIENRVEALEFYIKENSPVAGVSLQHLNLKPNLLIACITRKGAIIIPGGSDTIEVGDTVVVITTNNGLRDIKDILR